MCRSAGETMDHLFLHCEVVREIWSLFFDLLVLIGCFRIESWGFFLGGGTVLGKPRQGCGTWFPLA